MNILMMTNTYKPLVGGIEKSIEIFSSEYRSMGHKTLIVAPVFKNMPGEEEGVYRIPAIQNFNGTDFSVGVPVPGRLKGVLDGFKPDIVHSHHPFLVGDTALRVSAGYDIPMVFTYHTMYEMNTHYVPGDSGALKKFVVELATGYCGLCDRVIAPSKSVKDLLKERGVETKIVTVPTGINIPEFSEGDGAAFRKRLGIPVEAFLVGYLGRLAEEKNMRFLADAVISFMKKRDNGHLLMVGGGDLEDEIRERLEASGLAERSHFAGILKGRDKIDAYHAMNVFVFASKSETQGLVLAEAMASGSPAIGLDAPGAREVIEDGINGYLLPEEDRESFSGAIDRVYGMDDVRRDEFGKKARAKAGEFDYKKSVKKTLDIYKEAIGKKHVSRNADKSSWSAAKRSIKKEMEIISNVVKSAGSALNIKLKKDNN